MLLLKPLPAAERADASSVLSAAPDFDPQHRQGFSIKKSITNVVLGILLIINKSHRLSNSFCQETNKMLWFGIAGRLTCKKES